MTADTPTPPPDAKRRRRVPWCLISCAASVALAGVVSLGFVVLLVWGWQDYAWNPGRIGDVTPGMKLQRVKDTLECPKDSSEPEPVSEIKNLRDWAPVLADLKPERSVLYYETVDLGKPGWRRAFIIFDGQHCVSEVRVFDLKVGMTEDEVRHWCGKPDHEYTAAQVRAMGGDYYVEGYAHQKRDVTGKVLIHDGLDALLLAWSIVYIYIDPSGKVEHIWTGQD